MTLLIVLISLAFNAALADKIIAATGGTVMVSYILIVHHFMLVSAAYGAVQEGRLFDALAYLLGLGFVLHHIANSVDLYTMLYGDGDTLGIVVVLMAYVVLPGAFALASVFYGGGRAVTYSRARRARPLEA